MKRYFLLLIAVVSITLLKAQPSEQDKKDAEALEIYVGGTFGKPKIMPNLTKLALVQVTVSYKQASTVSVTKVEKKRTLFGQAQGKAATASVTAYLETTDTELTADDYQSITDHFYNYFQKALKANGVDTVGWDKVVAGELYKDGKEEKVDANEQEKDGGQWWTSSNAHHGNVMFSGTNYFAFGKAKKAARFAEELDAPLAFINVTVDFADIQAQVDVKTTGYKSTWTPSYNTIGQSTKASSKTSVAAFMKVSANGGQNLLWNQKSHQEIISVVRDIAAEMNYADALTEDEERAKKRSKLFSISFSKKLESTPVVITTTKEKYIAAAKRALENYADAFIAKAKVVKKD